MQNKSLWTYYVECFTLNYANFRGRARRSEYWGFVLFNVLFSIIFSLVAELIAGLVQMPGLAVFANLYTLVAFIPGVAVSVRRMHDVGRSGWWLLVPLVNLYFACCDSEPGDNKWGANPKGL